jgi:hypothetical protein
MVNGYPPRSGGSPASGLLPGRVHFPVQPPLICQPRKALLALSAPSRRHRSPTLQIHHQVLVTPERPIPRTTICRGYLSEVNTQPKKLSAMESGDVYTRPTVPPISLQFIDSNKTQAPCQNRREISLKDHSINVLIITFTKGGERMGPIIIFA